MFPLECVSTLSCSCQCWADSRCWVEREVLPAGTLLPRQKCTWELHVASSPAAAALNMVKRCFIPPPYLHCCLLHSTALIKTKYRWNRRHADAESSESIETEVDSSVVNHILAPWEDPTSKFVITWHEQR